MNKYLREIRDLEIAYSKKITSFPAETDVYIAFWGQPTLLGYEASLNTPRSIKKQLSNFYKIPKKRIGIMKIKAKDIYQHLDQTATILEGEVIQIIKEQKRNERRHN